MYKLNLKKIRKSKRMSQKDLSILLGVSQTYISALERGQYHMRISFLIKLSNLLEVPLCELIEYKNNYCPKWEISIQTLLKK